MRSASSSTHLTTSRRVGSALVQNRVRFIRHTAGCDCIDVARRYSINGFDNASKWQL